MSLDAKSIATIIKASVKNFLSLSEKKGLKIVNWNIRSLKHKFKQFECIFDSVKIDIICLSETWLKADTTNDQIAVQGYHLLRSDRKTKGKGRGGGLCAYILDKYMVNSSKYQDLDVNTQHLETMTFELNLPQTRPIVIIQFYRPPNGIVDQAFEGSHFFLEKHSMTFPGHL